MKWGINCHYLQQFSCANAHLTRIETQNFAKFCIVTISLHLPKLRYIPHEFLHDKKSSGRFIPIY